MLVTRLDSSLQTPDCGTCNFSDRMLFVAVFAVLAAFASADVLPLYSYSPSVGSGSGSSYTLTGEGRITAIRVWERGHIYGVQFRYGFLWSNAAAYTYGTPEELELYEGETIVQISGKYSHYIQSIIFVTSLGRSLHVGQPSGSSFNLYPEHREAELVFISGRYHGGLTSIGAHWAVVDPNFNSSRPH